jgi:hypothetical protein
MTKTKSQIQTEIAKLQEQLKELELSEKQKELIYIPKLKIEVERKLHTDMNYFSKIKIPDGFRLLKFVEFQEIINNHFDKFIFSEDNENIDEAVEQPINKLKDKYPYWNVWLQGLIRGYASEFDGYSRNFGYVDGSLFGVRFCRDVKDKK